MGIAYGPEAANALGRLEWPTVGAALKRVVIDAAGHIGDAVLSDPAGTFRKAYGVSASALLLVRPDGYLAHIAVNDMLVSTRTATRSLTPLQVGQETLEASKSSSSSGVIQARG